LAPKLQGIWSPMPTPLTKDGGIDKAGIRTLVDFLVEGGIDGLFPLGTSGEFALLTREERVAVVRAVVDQANGRVPVFAGVSDPSTENIVRFSADAKDAGVDGVIATPPYYYATTNEALYKHFRLIAEEVDLPLMLYNIPEWTHVFVPPEVVRPLAEENHIVGMKYTEYNLLNLLRFIADVGDKIAVFTGSDAMAYTNLEFGGSGAIIGVANVAPKIASKIFDAYRSGDFQSARDAQLQLLPLIQAIGIGKFPAGLKETMKLIGIPVGEAKEPLPRLSNEEVRLVKHYLGEAGFRAKSKSR
jgi:4-hydroxy-tetrahydrodipicolinate synthase